MPHNIILEAPLQAALYLGRSLLEPIRYTRESIMEKGVMAGIESALKFTAFPIILDGFCAYMGSPEIGALVGLIFYIAHPFVDFN